MLGVSEVKSWDVGALDALNSDLQDRHATLSDLEGSLDAASNSLSWGGIGFDEFAGYFRAAESSILDMASAAGALSQLVSELAESVRAIKEALNGLVETAESQNFQVADSGDLIDLIPPPAITGPGSLGALALAV